MTDGNAQASIRSTDAELVRVTLNLPRSVLDKVERLAAAHGVNKTSIIVRAIELEDFLDSITRRGGKLLVEKANGDINEVIFR